jgi:hypothetical protein
VERSIAEPRSTDGRRFALARLRFFDGTGFVTGVLVVVVMLAIYTASNRERSNFYNHFVWQASAWLEGESAIRYPVYESEGLGASNDQFQDVLPIVDADGNDTGRGFIPFPPLPAVALLPFVALWGLATDAQFIATIIGALDVGLVFWMLGRLGVRPSVRLLTTVFFGLGTVFWYAAELGTTWYLAHIVAVGLATLAIGVALGADRFAAGDALARARHLEPLEDGDIYGDDGGRVLAHGNGLGARVAGLAGLFDGRQFVAGLLLGLAAGARLPVVLGLPFLVLVGSGGRWTRRGFSAGLGATIPIAGLLLYNYVTTGQIFHPAYEYLYRVEISFYPFLPEYSYLNYNPDWSIEDIRYVPQNFGIMFFNLPEIMPRCSSPDMARRVFDEACPFLRPRGDGMSLLLTSPAWLLAVPALRLHGRSRLVTGAVLAITLIAFVNLMHFSQGWVQFGYRFSNDFAPFGLLLVALGLERLGGNRAVAIVIVGLSVVINAWGVAWGQIMGW